MRQLTSILAFLVLYLAIKPGADRLTMNEAAEKSCCSHACIEMQSQNTEEEPSSDNDCAGKICNPFEVCGLCILDCLHFNNRFILVDPTLIQEMHFAFQCSLIPQFAPDFWQPPKIA